MANYAYGAPAPTQISHIELLQRLHYDPLTGIFTWNQPMPRRRHSSGSAGGIDRHGYLAISIQSKRFLAHRLAWFYTTGEWPAFDIDHVDGDRLNNRIENLRVVPRKINLQNKRNPQRNNRSGFLGVVSHYGKFRAQIQLNGKKIIVGSRFATAEAASAAYVQAKRALHIGCTI